MQKIDFRRDILSLKDKLYRVALRITLNKAEAEDVVQDTMMRAWDRREEWQQLQSAEAFCLTIARRLAIDRSEKGDNVLTEALTIEHDRPTDASNPYERMVTTEQLDLLHRLINSLPEQQRTIMQLRDVEEKSYREIAGILNLTEEQVKVYLFRARQKVKQRFLDIDHYGL